MYSLVTIRRYIFCLFALCQQDSAPTHRARDTIELLRHKTPQFISPDMWPANSPADDHILGTMPQYVYRVLIHDMEELRQPLIETWAEFQQSMVDAIDQWRKRMEACVHAEGGRGHFTLNTCCGQIYKLGFLVCKHYVIYILL